MNILPIIFTILAGGIVFGILAIINGRWDGYGNCIREVGRLDKIRIKILGKTTKWKIFITFILLFIIYVRYWGLWYNIKWDITDWIGIGLFVMPPAFWSSWFFWGIESPEIDTPHLF